MYSTLIVLDKPRHLRYTFAAIADLDSAIPGGFYNLFKLPVNGETGFNILRDVLYAGLQWEDPFLTIQELGLILIYFCCNDAHMIVGLWKKVFDTLDYQKWTNNPKELQEEKSKSRNDSDEPTTIPELMDQIENVAYSTVRLSPSELYALTPREFSLILDNFDELENKRAGMICATIMNSVGGKKNGEPFKITDFISDSREPRIMSNQEIKSALISAFGGI